MVCVCAACIPGRPPTVGGNPDVRQCADLGQAVGMARFGQLHAAAFDGRLAGAER